MNRIDVVYALLEAADPVFNVETLDSSAVVARVEAELGYTATAASRPAEDIPTNRQVTPGSRMRRQRWLLRPALAAVAAFAATVAVLGGSVTLGVAIRQPGLDMGSALISEAVSQVAATASGWRLLIPAIAVAVALVAALLVRNQQARARKERSMATTIETTPAEQLETTQRNNRWLVAMVVGLAIALVALGAWVMFDLASEPETVATDDINALYDDYIAAYREADTEALYNLTTENYTFTSFGVTRDRVRQAAVISTAGGLQVERVGDLLVLGDSPYYYVAVAERIRAGDADYVGTSAYRVIETEDGLKIVEHTWVGNL